MPFRRALGKPHASGTPGEDRRQVLAFRRIAWPLDEDHLRAMAETSGRFDVAIVGGGPAGIAAALIAHKAGRRSVLFAPPAKFPPGRTAALLGGSIDFLSELGIWEAVSPHAEAITTIRLVDATSRLIRAPEATFYASEVGLQAFGFNIPNGDLVDVLYRHAQAMPELTIVPAPVESIAPGEDEVLLSTNDERFTARLVVAADGARSLAREAAGIRVKTWGYRQSTLVATLAVRFPHQGASTEFHTENGPFTLVPLPGDRMSLVWVDRPNEIERALRLSDAELSREVEERARSIHGAMTLDSKPAVFPLSAALAVRFAARRIVLVGEAAHVFPPIGAQGLNLGFRDVRALKHLLVRHPADPGSPAALQAYHAARQGDVRTRTLAVDLLNRSLLTDFLPVQLTRGVGLAMASSIPVLRRTLIRQGLAEDRSVL
jgi:2-octaprenyl-6-methoxyphenol hydroxylase